MRKFFNHDGEYAEYLIEESKVLAEERARVRRMAAIQGMYFWQTFFMWMLVLLTPKSFWSNILEIKYHGDY